MSFKSNPLSEKQKSALDELVKEISAEQIIWLSGFLEGKLSGLNGKIPELNGKTVIVSEPVAQKSSASLANLTVLYGTETGKSKELAEKLAEKAAFRNISATVINMYDYELKKLSHEENLAIIVSTHGEGDPPDMAEDFYKYVTGKRVPKLANVSYSVLALGDKSYKFFCKAGEEIDAAFKKSGAFNLTPLVKCDLDFEVKADIWMNNLLLNLVPATQEAAESVLPVEKVAVEYSKKNPFRQQFSKKSELPDMVQIRKFIILNFHLKIQVLLTNPVIR
jgi:sulfite reductase (NADPH) flavoprotein alpha-component